MLEIYDFKASKRIEIQADGDEVGTIYQANRVAVGTCPDGTKVVTVRDERNHKVADLYGSYEVDSGERICPECRQPQTWCKKHKCYHHTVDFKRECLETL